MTDEGAACLFCRIVEGEIPAEIVGENAQAIAIRDIAPVAPIHLLVIPRRHLADATALGPNETELLGSLFELANEVASRHGVAESGFRVVANVGDDGGNTVPHLHLHVLGGRQLVWPPG